MSTKILRKMTAERKRQLQKPVEICVCTREYEFGPVCESIHNEISIVVWNASTEAEAIEKMEAFLDHVRSRGYEAYKSGDEDETADVAGKVGAA